MARALGLAAAVHPGPLRQPPRPGISGDPDSYPGRDDVVAYLTDYARDFELPVELSSRVRAVRQGERGYLVEIDNRSYEADQVVIATGPFQIPRVPAIAEHLDPGITQFHSSKYRGPHRDLARWAFQPRVPAEWMRSIGSFLGCDTAASFGGWPVAARRSKSPTGGGLANVSDHDPMGVLTTAPSCRRRRTCRSLAGFGG